MMIFKEYMLYPQTIKNPFYLKSGYLLVRAITFFVLCSFFTAAQAQNDALLQINGQTLLKSRAKGLGLNQGVKSIEWKKEPLEGVNIEVRKNDVTIAKATSGKKGKYTFEIPVSTADPKNDFTVYFSKEGLAPKTIAVNSFLPKDEFTKYSSAKYDIGLDIPLIATTIKDIVPDKSYAKIKWDKAKEHKFTIDPTYERISASEEQKIDMNPDQYYSALAKKKKKAEDAIAKNKAAAEAKLKADELAKQKAEEEAQKLAAQKAKEEAERIEREKAEALRLEALKKHIADSIAEAERKKSMELATTKLEIKKIVKPIVNVQNEIKNFYEASEKYSINMASKSLREQKEKRNREKGKNLSAKYESLNILTSLLDEVDEFDKKSKKE
jgi:hypothetical protein